MNLFGLIGYPLSHSFSATYFTKKFEKEGILDAEFRLFELNNIEEIKHLLFSEPLLKGLSVTIPYKEKIIPYLDELDEIAQKVGAVNSVKISKVNQQIYLKGFNTDVIGFEKTLIPMLKNHHKQALVLGTGGASKAVVFVFEKLKIPYRIVSRNTSQFLLTYNELTKEIMDTHQLIINTTPVGMFPNIIENPLLPYHFLNSSHFLFDLIYNPEETLFLQKGKIHNSLTKSGLDMLIEQAEASWKIWNIIDENN
ncbi:MAG: shikimate dehydrogenase [Bacteroidetes bacterium]|nr:shikimate dehydrogenase [Bacteroidota bacterium]